MLKTFIEKYTSIVDKPKIFVVGDLLIDEFFDVSINRLSPEVPVPIMLSSDSTPIIKYGGAGNVFKQINAFNNIICHLFCFNDILEFDNNNINYINLNTGQIPRKKRFICDNRQMARWDIEQPDYGEKDIKNKRNDLFDLFNQKLNEYKPSIVILSDYSKGLFDINLAQKIIQLCNKHNIITIVDPKNTPLEAWKNCTIFKPNCEESKKITKLNKFNEQSDYVKNKINCQHVLITDRGNGVFGTINYKGIPVKNVNPVGGGDTFCAILAISLAMNISIEDSVDASFTCGSIYVSNNKQNNCLSIEQLNKFLHPIESKIININQYLKIKLPGKIGFTNGCYDLLHYGHIKLLEYAKTMCDTLIVGVNSDESIKKIKGDKRPIVPLQERLYQLASLSYVDYVISFDEDTPLNLIKEIKPNCIIKGGSYKKEDVIGYSLVENIYLAPMVNGLSTTNRINKICETIPNF